MTIANLSPDEVELGGYRLPILGQVQRVKATTYASKVTVGPTRRGNQTLADEWVMNQWRAGALIRLFDDSEHQERFWFGDADTTKKLKMMLPPEAVNHGTPVGAKYPIDLVVEYRGLLYVSFGGDIFSWDPVNLWSPLLHSLGVSPTRALIFKGDLYYCYKTGYSVYSDGTGNAVFRGSGPAWHDNPNTDTTNPLILTGSPTQVLTFVYFEAFDANPSEKLMGLDTTGTLWASVDGLNWDSGIGGTLYDVQANSLIAYRDTWDNPALFIGTDHGLFASDIWSKTIYPTALRMAPTPNAGVGATVWTDGSLYFPAQLSLWRYVNRGGEIINIGFNKMEDDGLPTDFRGEITQILGTPYVLLAVIDATRSVAAAPSHVTLQGTVSLTQGSSLVTGAGTNFTSQLVVGNSIRFGNDDLVYTVASFSTTYPTTQMTLNPIVMGGTVSTTQGSATLSGAGTLLRSILSVGSVVQIGSDPQNYTVASIASETSLTLSPPVLSGTVAVTNGSATVNGTGTKFTSELAVGASLIFQSDVTSYVVSAIASDTSLTLTTLYGGTSAASGAALKAVGYIKASQTAVALKPQGYLGPSASGLTYSLEQAIFFNRDAEWGVSTFPPPAKEGLSCILQYNGQGWHALYLGTIGGSSFRSCVLSGIDTSKDFRQVYFGDGLVLRSVALPEGNYDPTQDSLYTYRPQAYWQSSWFLADQQEIPKLAISLRLGTMQLTTTETIDVYYALNLQETWSYLGTASSANVDANGEVTLPFNGRVGTRFNAIALKLVFNRNPSNSSLTPVLLFFDLHYKLRPPVLWGWTFTLDTSRIDRLDDVWAALETMSESVALHPFAYRWQDEPTYRYVDIVSVEGQETPGGQGRYQVTVVEIDPPVAQ